MAESTVVRTKRDWLIEITDGTNTYTIAYEAGDFKYDVPRYAVNNFLDRGEIGPTPSLRKGDDQPMTLGWSTYLRDLGDTAEPEAYQTLLDLLSFYTGGYTDDNWTSTLGSNSDVETWTVNATCDGTAFGEADKTLQFPFTSLRGSVANGDPDTITVAGTSYRTQPTIT